MKLLDLFCGAGGCSVGYHQAGFEVVGVDNRPQPHYPFEFHQADALEFVAAHGHEFDVIHASPPCQGYSRLRHLPWLAGREYPLLIPAVRAALQATGRPYVIENVSGAPLAGAELCGAALGLPLRRHRRFECSILLLFPPCPGHPVMFSGRSNMRKYGRGHGITGLPPGEDPAEAMGIDWMTGRELRQSIPPTFTRWIGQRLIEALQS